VITSDGKYRIMAPPEKVLLTKRMLYCGPFDQSKGASFTLIYRDENKIAWGKKVHIKQFITDKVYDLCKSSPTGLDFLKTGDRLESVRLLFVPKPRQKIKEYIYDLKNLKPCGLGARGTRLHAKPVQRFQVFKAVQGKKPAASKKPVAGKNSGSGKTKTRK
jgi:hypothetical protein